MATSAPACARVVAMIWPSPLAPPVTSARRPSRRNRSSTLRSIGSFPFDRLSPPQFKPPKIRDALAQQVPFLGLDALRILAALPGAGIGLVSRPPVLPQHLQGHCELVRRPRRVALPPASFQQGDRSCRLCRHLDAGH